MGYSGEPIPWMIEATAFLSVVIQRWEDFAIIFTLSILNAVVGFWQEHKADNAIALLKKRLAPKARVLRDSAWREIPVKKIFSLPQKAPSGWHVNSCLWSFHDAYWLGISWLRLGLCVAQFHHNYVLKIRFFRLIKHNDVKFKR